MSTLQRGEEMNKDLDRLLELEKFKTIAEIQDDIPFSCPEEYKQLKEEIELAMRIMDNTPIIDIKDIEREPTEEEIKSAKEAEKYYLDHEPISFDSKTKLFQHLHALERSGYIIPEWYDKHDLQGNIIGSYKVFKINSNAVKKK